MLDFPLMQLEKLPVVDRIHPQRNKFTAAVGNMATDENAQGLIHVNFTDRDNNDI